jgi:hypothetical protein
MTLTGTGPSTLSIKSDKSIKGGVSLESQLVGTHNN